MRVRRVPPGHDVPEGLTTVGSLGGRPFTMMQQFRRPFGRESSAIFAEEYGGPFRILQKSEVVPLVARNHASQRGMRSNAHLIVTAELRAVLVRIRQTLVAAPLPVSHDPLVPQLHRALWPLLFPLGGNADQPFLFNAQPRIDLGSAAEHVRNRATHRSHLIVNAFLPLSTSDGRVTWKKLRL